MPLEDKVSPVLLAIVAGGFTVLGVLLKILFDLPLTGHRLELTSSVDEGRGRRCHLSHGPQALISQATEGRAGFA